MLQVRHVRRDRVRHPCCGERIARTANVGRRLPAAAVISIDEMVRYPQCPRCNGRCIYATAVCAAHDRCAMRAGISISQNVGRAVRRATVESGIRPRAGLLRDHDGADVRMRPG
ncbi:hypothetical protein CEQ23_03300 [Burkholderia cepacia]|uniref:Transposase n=1 Tax=Burkholderia cepacia TaxID=292 RepID=A0ABN5D5T1_BURCE|nr:hypothetical protein CEQ23_03300 [Burkholderia cepacia]ATF80317.1 hypothetical protein CO711_23475 [Burkholderia cepacia]QCY08618.1 hypothetical protein EJ998_37150 [Burkholderia cepacia ATCC 25416]